MQCSLNFIVCNLNFFLHISRISYLTSRKTLLHPCFLLCVHTSTIIVYILCISTMHRTCEKKFISYNNITAHTCMMMIIFKNIILTHMHIILTTKQKFKRIYTKKSHKFCVCVCVCLMCIAHRHVNMLFSCIFVHC